MSGEYIPVYIKKSDLEKILGKIESFNITENLQDLYNAINHQKILEKYRDTLIEKLGKSLYENLIKEKPIGYSLIALPNGSMIIFDYQNGSLALILHRDGRVNVRYFDNILFYDAAARTFDALLKGQETYRITIPKNLESCKDLIKGLESEIEREIGKREYKTLLDNLEECNIEIKSDITRMDFKYSDRTLRVELDEKGNVKYIRRLYREPPMFLDLNELAVRQWYEYLKKLEEEEKKERGRV